MKSLLYGAGGAIILAGGVVAADAMGFIELPFQIQHLWMTDAESSVRHERSLEQVATLPVSEMYAEAQDRIADGNVSVALVILEGAAARDHAPSALAIGEMYDPRLWGALPSPMTQPSELEARRWYARASELGDQRGNERLAELQAWLSEQ